ncbi:Glycerol-3-phosphate 1-O-acyltransferase [Bertholletia excelsa]
MNSINRANSKTPQVNDICVAISGNGNELKRSSSQVSSASSQSKFQRYPSIAHSRSDLSDHVLIFSVEGTVLRSSSMFPYFMLVAFEAGSFLRALILFLLYPFICFLGDDVGLKIMVMVCFFGMKKEDFRAGKAVLRKFFLEDVGLESFEVLRRSGKKVAIELVVARDLQVCCGYFVGPMEEKTKTSLDDILDDDQKMRNKVIGIESFNKSLDQLEIYLVSEGDRRNWHQLPRDRFPRPLIFHDGRLAFRPTPLATLAMFMWVPFGIPLALIRTLIGLSLPYNLLIPILAFIGLRLKVKNSSYVNSFSKPRRKGVLYVCNHRTFLDPLYFSFGLKKPVAAVTYSLSRVSEVLPPIRTVRLTRDRFRDAEVMDKLLKQGDMIVCPEGTTCREPYLLRFSPLFSELSEDIVPVAMDTQVSVFYGATASGFKCLDPFFFLMNPFPCYTIQFLDKVKGGKTENWRFVMANFVQRELGKALGFQCIGLTRKDKYLILASNEGRVSSDKRH